MYGNKEKQKYKFMLKLKITCTSVSIVTYANHENTTIHCIQT